MLQTIDFFLRHIKTYENLESNKSQFAAIAIAFQMKKSYVIPIFKSENRSLMGINRPIKKFPFFF